MEDSSVNVLRLFLCNIFSDNGELAFTFELFNGNDPVDPGTAIALGTDLVGKLTVSESGFPANKFTVFFISVTADKETPDNPPAPVYLVSAG